MKKENKKKSTEAKHLGPKRKKKNPLDEVLEQLEEYEEGCQPTDLMSSGE